MLLLQQGSFCVYKNNVGASSPLKSVILGSAQQNPGTQFIEQHNQHQSWDESQSGLTQAGSFIVGGLASIATMGAASGLSQAMVLGANASSSAIAAATTFQTMQIGAISAGLTSAASTIAVGAVNGRVDGKALVQNVLMSAATGGITAGVTKVAGLSDLSKLKGVDKTMAIAQKVGISTGVGTAVDMVVYGKTQKDVLGRLTTSTALALGQNAIGDVAVTRGLDEGSLGKTIAHAAVGGALGGTAGAIGGAVSEQMSAHLIDAKDQAGSAKIGLTAATVTMLTGGDVKDMSIASATAASAHEYNAGLHQDAQPILEEYLKDKSPAEQRGYIQALMREKRADAGVSPEDPKYTEIRSDVALGGLVDPQRLENVHQLMASNGMPDASKYTVSDGVSDYFARHDEGFTRTGQIFKIGAGYGGAVASTVTTTAGWAGPWAPFVGPAVTVASNALRVASAAYGLDAAKDFVLPYQHVEGANVLESYRNPVESYASRKGKAVGFDAAMIVSGYGAGQLIGGLAKTGPGQKLVANVVGGKVPVVTPKVSTTNVVQPTQTSAQKKLADIKATTVLEKHPNPTKSDSWTHYVEFKGNRVYQRNDLIDPNKVHPVYGTNLEAMKQGKPPIGPDGKPINLHHTIQTNDGPIAEITQTFHQQNTGIIHINPNSIKSGINRPKFEKWKAKYWTQRAKDFN